MRGFEETALYFQGDNDRVRTELELLTGSPTSPVRVGRNCTAQTKGLSSAEAGLASGTRNTEACLPQEPSGWTRTDMAALGMFSEKATTEYSHAPRTN